MKPSTPKTEPPSSTQLRKAVFGAAPQMILLLVLVSGSAFAQGANAPLLTTFTNPTPAFFELFGQSVAAVGTDRVIIGSGANAAYLFSSDGTLQKTFTVADPLASYFGGVVVSVGSDRVLISDDSYGLNMGEQIGRAYLFNTNGSLLTTFTNPNPAHVRVFGVSTAVLGSDRLIIGGLPDPNNSAPYLGAVYVYGTNGTLLNTITNPTPAVFNDFGQSVAAVGNDRVLIGAPLGNPGLAYLYRTNGTLLTTFTNPAPVTADSFGTPVAAVGSDRVLIGAAYENGGAVHLFSTDGTLLTTFTNPIPTVDDQFGFSVAVVANNRILIGAIRDDTGAHDTGSAYLFSTNGTLLTTITNPIPAVGGQFGYSVTVVGSNRILIGANRDNTGAPDTGAAYLFSTNGTLLNTFTNPTPETFDLFGGAVAAVGPDRVIIGAAFDGTGAVNAGAAYLFDLPYPQLSIAQNDATVSLSWITPETGLTLQQTSVLGSPTVWSNTSDSVSINGLTNVVQQVMTTTNRFFRLHRP